MADITVSEDVVVTGMLDRDANALQLRAKVTVSFSIPPAIFSPGMKVIVEKELQQAITRLIETAKKEKK